MARLLSPKIDLLRLILANAESPFHSVADNARAVTRFHRRRHHSRKPGTGYRACDGTWREAYGGVGVAVAPGGRTGLGG
ncbi:hypothetical protein ES332_A09G099600v1 [Gossypium tomentosum]|uniref:Uncharacterized protein n=1 Tax=Gossypium tomentosum TaxID=34277 RepID=A0A5D2P278_GOSTO|nr:hypothetical protein ES332_A09G099600v1 [Gossypium tomentosum]